MSADPSGQTEELKRTALELFGGLSDSYERALDLATAFQDRYWKSWIARESRVGRSTIVLDVGCGTLLLEERLRASGCSVVGIDLALPMIRIGQRKGLPNVPLLVHGDAEYLPFKDSSFDAVVSCYVPKYVAIEKLASELSRVAKPGARIVVYDFVRPSGLYLPLLALYVYGVMRIAGWLLGLSGSKEAFTFKNLPGIVGGAVWDRRISRIFSMHGVRTERIRRMTGGVVAGYVGIKDVESSRVSESLDIAHPRLGLK